HLRRSGIHLYDGKSAALLSEYLDYRSLSTPVIDDVDGDGVPDLFVMQEIAMEPYGARLSRFTIRGVPPFDAARSFSGFRGHPGMRGGRWRLRSRALMFGSSPLFWRASFLRLCRFSFGGPFRSTKDPGQDG